MGLSGITSAHFNIYVLLACKNNGDCEKNQLFSLPGLIIFGLWSIIHSGVDFVIPLGSLRG
jgi:hypothetical protein